MRREKLFWTAPLVIAAADFILTLIFHLMSFWQNVGEHILYLMWLYIAFMLLYVARSNARARKLRRRAGG